jgi:probable lipoprotein NlpC
LRLRRYAGPVVAVFLAGVLSAPGCRTRVSPLPADCRYRTDRVLRVLEDAFHRWRGTPYRWGGADERGVDCSGLVSAIYRNGFSLTLPRKSTRMSRSGVAVPADSLLPGDLVFFRIGLWGDHVGIYYTNGSFIHASKGAGVTRSQLDSSYWRRRYRFARRILPLCRRPGRAAYPIPSPERRCFANKSPQIDLASTTAPR